VKSSWIGLTIGLILALPAAAERMNVDTHTIVIGKLEGALEELPKSSTERRSISVRLADLYADRARLLNLQKQDTKCTDCSDGSKDRVRAIQLYSEVVNGLPATARGPVLLQLAHLQNIQGDVAKATKTLERATDTRTYDSDITSRAHAQLGEIKFRKAEFAKAEGHFKSALSNQEISNPGFITYRLAWSQLNQGKFDLATATLIKLLKSPELLTVENQEGVTFDDSFHQDITRDLIVFLARGNVGESEVELLLELTPEALRRENLYAFANELERLGKKYSATLAWRAYFAEGDNSPTESLETQIRLAQLQWDMGRKEQALDEYTKATELFKRKGCDGDKCGELEKRFKNFVINWNRIEKDRPTPRCLQAYKQYLKAFDQDPEMYYKAATVADQLKNHSEATRLYAAAATLAAEQVRRGKNVNKELLEASLMQQIESAELSKDKTARLKAYDAYIELNPKGRKIVEVRYQKAQVTYEMGQHQAAFNQFFDIATENPKDQRALRVKAADLSLDALAAMKKDQEIFETAPKLAKLYPERKAEFARIQRQAVILMASRVLDKKEASASELRRELEKLNAMEMGIAAKEDQILILKNRIAIGVRLQDLNEVQSASSRLVAVKGLNENDRELGLRNLSWVAELKLDFKTALRFSRQMKHGHLKEDDKHLRLAMLTELAGQDPTREYRKALTATNSKEKSLSIRATLVRRSNKPWNALKEHAPQLSRNNLLLATLLIEVYGRDGNDAKAKSFIKQYGLRNSALAKLMDRQGFFAEWKREDRRLSQHRLNSRSDALLQKTLIERISKLNRQDYLGREALKLKDWGAQFAVISTVARENRRLYNELLALPAPRRLTKEQKEQYLALLKAKADPFRVRAEEADKKLSEFKDNDRAIDEMVAALENSKGRVRELLKRDALTIARVTSGSQRRQLEKAAASQPAKPSINEIARAKTRLANDPFDTGVAKDLKVLAEKRGDVTMVAFLDARIQQLNKGVRQ
jgi:tetratricopeptide (TPR) repeat protein/ribosomal protein S8